MRYLFAIGSIACLIVCLVVPVIYFHGGVDEAAYKNTMTAASVGWFVFATLWGTRKSQA